jgi:hypothetical protein
MESPLNLIDWYEGKSTGLPLRLIDAWEQISELIGPIWVVHPSAAIIKTTPKDTGMFVHSDSPGKGACHLLSQTDTSKTCCELDYGVVAYFGDFEGGEIFYPDINTDGTVKNAWELVNNTECFEYKPEKGDVVIHSAFDPYSHGTRPVTSGIRYAYSNFSLKAADNPGTFHNYGTPEYYDAIGNKTKEEVTSWLAPLKWNDQFSLDVVEEIKKSGLQGPELAETFFKHLAE